MVSAWAFAGDCGPEALVSNTCEILWPSRNGKRIVIPEVDRGAWIALHGAANFIRDEQRELLSRLEQVLIVR